MAEKIFSSVFREENSMRPVGYNEGNGLGLTKAHSLQERSYEPKNSTLVSEKTIERNGRQVLIRKYSVN